MNTRDWLNEDEEDNNYRILSTLNPTYLKSTDYTNLSHHLNPSISFLPRTSSFTVRFFQKDGKHQPFPPRTRGFFYYRSPQLGLPPLAGGLRFRLTSSGHPSSFSNGVDLLHEGLPWQISLGSVAAAVGPKAVLREHLLLEGLVTQADLDRCRAVSPNKKRFDHKITLFRLKQPFPVAFDRGLHAWIVGSGDAPALRWTYAYMFADNRMSMRPLVRPYSGSALAQFELSTLPEHAGGTVVVFRIVNMLEPPSCVLDSYDNAIPMPVEGELVRRPMGHARASRLQPWFCDLAKEDSDSAAALRALVEVRYSPFFFPRMGSAKTKSSTHPDGRVVLCLRAAVSYALCNRRQDEGDIIFAIGALPFTATG
ncbi:hypothetical protein B0H16DRAFT_1310562 [Mycena metata]|uniref:Uncharacterized protein n=1 Tax=Mycena metata TaxID=1033252 RepID=A0AAD7JHH2_9AGAR|nr:hypothetical protein B0H16DRAFT_1310562 [Mycena metata]